MVKLIPLSPSPSVSNLATDTAEEVVDLTGTEVSKTGKRGASVDEDVVCIEARTRELSILVSPFCKSWGSADTENQAYSAIHQVTRQAPTGAELT